jgi:hypothetical protein
MSGKINSLRVDLQDTGMVEVSQTGFVTIWRNGEKVRRHVGELVDMVLATVTDKPHGTYVCPICRRDRPHSHSEEEQYLEQVVRPAFETRMHDLFVRSPRGVFARGYYLAYSPTSKLARSDGGWAERQSPTGPYRTVELQSAWELFQSGWFAARSGHSSEENKP